MLNPLMSSSHGLELKSSMNSRVLFVVWPGTGRGLYIISVIASPVFRLDGPAGSRTGTYCAQRALPAARKTASFSQ
jgi:hypothetical protein